MNIKKFECNNQLLNSILLLFQNLKNINLIKMVKSDFPKNTDKSI